jgi:hypothetical protein
VNEKLILELYSLMGFGVSDIALDAQHHVLLDFTREVERAIGINSGDAWMFAGHS